jgi:hypothetical protein
MPSARKTATKPLAPASKTYTRRVRILGASFNARVPGPDGRLVEIAHDARFGDEVELSAIECARLDSLGVLCPPGTSRDELQREHDARLSRYRSARSGVEAFG